MNEAMQEFINPLADLGDKVTKLTTELGMKAMGNADEVGAAAVDYLRVCGHLVLCLLLRPHGQGGAGQAGQRRTRFYTAKTAHGAVSTSPKLLPETAGLIRTARSGVAPLMAMDEAAVSDAPAPVTIRHPRRRTRMKKSVLAAMLLVATGAAFAQSSPVGLWKDHRRRKRRRRSPSSASPSPAACCRARSRKIVDPAKQDSKCEKCSDARKDQKVLGMTIVEGVKKNSDEPYWDGGHILDPNNGNGLQGPHHAEGTVASRSTSGAISARR